MIVEQSHLSHSRGYRMDYRITAPGAPTDPHLHVFFHGYSRIERHVPPVFARVQWAGTGGAVCLFLSDPLLRHTTGSDCGWFLLGEDEFMGSVLELRRSLIRRWGLDGTVWHGLSSGAYAALRHCCRADGDDLAFVIAPHDDPTVLPQWEREAGPFRDLPGMAEPTPTSGVLNRWLTGGDGRSVHVVLSEKDSYFALAHLRPILDSVDGSDRIRAVKLHDGRGHGFIADADYTSQLADAVAHWERRRSAPRTTAGGRRG